MPAQSRKLKSAAEIRIFFENLAVAPGAVSSASLVEFWCTIPTSGGFCEFQSRQYRLAISDCIVSLINEEAKSYKDDIQGEG